jgi:hypothetical protein
MPRYEQKNLFSAKELYPQPETKEPDSKNLSPEELVWDPEGQKWVREVPLSKGRRGKGYRAFKKEFERLFGNKSKRK